MKAISAEGSVLQKVHIENDEDLSDEARTASRGQGGMLLQDMYTGPWISEAVISHGIYAVHFL